MFRLFKTSGFRTILNKKIPYMFKYNLHCHSFWFIYQQNQAFNEMYWIRLQLIHIDDIPKLLEA